MTSGFRAFSWEAIDAIGSEAASWLGAIVTSEVPPVGTASWSLLLSKQGKIQGELVLTRESEEAVTINVRGGDAAQVRAALDHYLVMEDVELGLVRSTAWAILTNSELDFVRRSLATHPEVHALEAPFGGDGTVLVRSSGDAAELGALLSEFARELPPGDWDAARVGLGLPVFGVDYDGGDNPHQASLERRAVSWKKGCYLGQEVVFMQDARGKVKRRLVRVSSSSEEPILPGNRVTSAQGEDAGRLTTVAGDRALARVHAPHFEAGTRLFVGDIQVAVEALDAGLFGRVGPADRLGQ